jgi:hypothetical protein
VSSELVLVVVFGAAALLAWIFVYRRPRVTQHLEEIGVNDFRRCLEVLLTRGYDLGFVVFELPGDQRFLEFSKYIKDQTLIGLQLDFPLAPWSEPYYEQVKGLLERKGIPYLVEDTPNGPVREFIQVDLGHDLDRAADLAREIVEQVFRMSPDTRLTADFQQVSQAKV